MEKTKWQLIQEGVNKRKDLYKLIKEIKNKEKDLKIEYKGKLKDYMVMRLTYLKQAKNINEKIKFMKGLLVEDPFPGKTLEELIKSSSFSEKENIE